MRLLLIIGLLLLATSIEAGGNAVVRLGLQQAGTARIGLMLLGGMMLFGYGLTLQLSPIEFGKLFGAYVSVIFTMAQLANYLAFKTPPTLPILVGGLFIYAGSLIIVLWRVNE